MLDSIMGYRQAQTIEFDKKAPHTANSNFSAPKSDTVFISNEARKLLEESKMQSASENTKSASETESSEKTLQQKLRDYIKNPTLAHALEKMAEAIDKIGLSAADKEEVYALVERVFRSGIPEKGALTDDALGSLKKELKKSGLLSHDQLNDLMGDIADIVEWAQREEDSEAAHTDNKNRKTTVR